jgi:hypothetical protein
MLMPRRSTMSRWLILGLGVAAFIVTLMGCQDWADSAAGTYHDTVLLGTWMWDVDSNTLAASRRADFHWRHATETTRYLVPENGARAAVVTGKSLEEIDAAFVRTQDLSYEWLSASDTDGVLRPGAIVVFRTSDGNLGKLRIEGYRASHDFSFPEAAHLEAGWKVHALQGPNMERYHLHVKWFLFE